MHDGGPYNLPASLDNFLTSFQAETPYQLKLAIHQDDASLKTERMLSHTALAMVGGVLLLLVYLFVTDTKVNGLLTLIMCAVPLGIILWWFAMRTVTQARNKRQRLAIRWVEDTIFRALPDAPKVKDEDFTRHLLKDDYESSRGKLYQVLTDKVRQLLHVKPLATFQEEMQTYLLTSPETRSHILRATEFHNALTNAPPQLSF